MLQHPLAHRQWSNMPNIFDDFLNTWHDFESVDSSLRIYEKDDLLHVELDIPGFQKKDVKIEVEGQYLRVVGERKDSAAEEQAKYFTKQKRQMSFERSFYLPAEVDKQKISAEMQDGVLSINFQKHEQAKPMVVDVK